MSLSINGMYVSSKLSMKSAVKRDTECIQGLAILTMYALESSSSNVQCNTDACRKHNE